MARRHTLIAAPTGSGKTLAAFLCAIDALVRQGLREPLADETHVLYVSPLKALSNDIEKNLRQPLSGIATELEAQGLAHVPITTSVRTGDTKASRRSAMTKRPPHIFVTTPESLYIMLTSDGGRRMLRTVRTVIIDEIHALVANKRGSHLALSLERLDDPVPWGRTSCCASACPRRKNPSPTWRAFWSESATRAATSSTAAMPASWTWRSRCRRHRSRR